MIPDEYDEDEAFVVASELRYDESEGWSVRVDPDDPFAGPEGDRSLDAVQATPLERTETDGGVRWTGELLVSGGVVTLLNGELAMLRRDADAPADPGCLQSPAGRCEEAPGETSLREFYEELVALEDGRPAFLRFDERSAEHEDAYEDALRRVGRHAPPSAWKRYDGHVPAAAERHLERVTTTCGDRTWTEEMLTYFDEDASTLECRLALAVDVDDPDALELFDGELDRDVERHAPADVVAMDRSELVPTDAYLAGTLYPELGE